MVEVILEHNGNIYQPIIVGEIQIKSVRTGSPKTLTFTLLRDEVIEYDEGDAVRVRVNNQNAFYGFIFKISGGKDNKREITAYDQLRYLKNKYTYIIENERVDQIVKSISEDFGLQVGTLTNTQYLYSAVEDNASLFDIILNASDETTRMTGEMYVLYDDNGYLSLDNIGNRKIDILLDAQTGENFTYSSSIDEETYNSIVLYNDPSQNGTSSENTDLSTRRYAYASDSTNIGKWGVLQYYAKYEDGTDPDTQAKQLLQLYNQKSRSLSLDNQLGDIRVMGGTLVGVLLDLGDFKISSYMLVEEVTHNITDDYHTMTLKLQGGGFNQ